MNLEKLKEAEVVEGQKLGHPSSQKKCCSKRSAGMPPNTGLAQKRIPMKQRKLLVFGMDCDTDTLGL